MLKNYLELQELDLAGRYVLSDGAPESPSCYLYPNDELRHNPGNSCYILNQVHSKRVLYTPEQYVTGSTGDGLVTDCENVQLAVTVADCLPIFLFIDGKTPFGIVHSGWRGTGIVVPAVESLIRLSGGKPSDVSALIGPGIGVCCYEVAEERVKRFPPECTIRRGGAPYLNLKKANEIVLGGLGIGRITIIDACTCCDARLHSYRREGPERFGRMVAMICNSRTAAK